jgi:predicted nuclease of predicted toxin-antitoxin system
MRFKIDENISDQVKDYLIKAGHDTHTTRDESLNGKPDEQIAAAAKREQRILLTLDSDFSNILRYPPQDYFGIMVLKLARQDNSSVLRALLKPVEMLKQFEIQGRLWVVTENDIRIRE